MRQASKRIPESAEKTVRDIRRATRRHHSAEEKIRIVRDGPGGDVAEHVSPALRSRESGIALGRRNHEAGAWKMHTDLADRGFAASNDDLMDARGDQFADDRIASGIVRSNADDLPRLPSDGIFRVSGCFRD